MIKKLEADLKYERDKYRSLLEQSQWTEADLRQQLQKQLHSYQAIEATAVSVFDYASYTKKVAKVAEDDPKLIVVNAENEKSILTVQQQGKLGKNLHLRL